MIVSCPECNGKVSDSALACPHCGLPAPATRLQGAPGTTVGPLDRVVCPHCGGYVEVGTHCPLCRSPFGYPSRPVDVHRSFVGQAVVTLVLYFLCWPVGIIANLLWYNEARRVGDATGVDPAGRGCLFVMGVIGVGITALVLLGLVTRGMLIG